MGIDPRIVDLRSTSQTGTGTTTPDIDRGDGEAAEGGEGEEEGEEAEGSLEYRQVLVLDFYKYFHRFRSRW